MLGSHLRRSLRELESPACAPTMATPHPIEMRVGHMPHTCNHTHARAHAHTHTHMHVANLAKLHAQASLVPTFYHLPTTEVM